MTSHTVECVAALALAAFVGGVLIPLDAGLFDDLFRRQRKDDR